MTFEEYVNTALVTTREDLKFWDNNSEEARLQLAAMCGLGLCGEFAEFQIDPTIDEAGDVTWYIAGLAKVFDLTLETKYPRYSTPFVAAGKVAELCKKYTFHRKNVNTSQVEEWLTEILEYIATKHDLSEVFEFNVNKLKKRYPNGFS